MMLNDAKSAAKAEEPDAENIQRGKQGRGVEVGFDK